MFKEPQYPFMLLQINTEEYKLSGNEGDAIEPLTLYAQINHKRDKDTGEVELDASTLNIREIESIKGTWKTHFTCHGKRIFISSFIF